MIKNKLFNLIFSLSITILFFSSAFSQVKIANTIGTPDQGAILDVESTNRGFLPPRISLTDALMKLNGVNPTVGTIIYSTNWNGDGNLGGLFIWKGEKWEPFDDSEKITASHLTVLKQNGQSHINGSITINWQSAIDVKQPAGDSPMWSSANPSKIIIRRKGLYFISASCRLEEAVTNEPRYFSISKNSQSTTGVGYYPPGSQRFSYRLTFNTSTTIYCEVGDEITLTSSSINTIPNVAPAGLLTTRMSVTQISNR